MAIREHEEQFRNCLGAFSNRISQLKADVDNLDATAVFSVKVYKQNDEIKHLAN